MVLVFILDEIYEGSAGKDTVRILHTRTVLCQSSHRHHLTRHNNRTHNMVSLRKVLYVPLFTNTIFPTADHVREFDSKSVHVHCVGISFDDSYYQFYSVAGKLNNLLMLQQCTFHSL